MSHFKRTILFSVLTLMLTALAIPGLSQSVWVPEINYDSKAGIDIQIPSFDGSEADFPTSVVYFYSHYALSEKYTLKLELPLSMLSADNSSDNAVGNPYIGININSDQSNLGADIGIRLPLAPNNFEGLITGLLIKNHDFAPFIPEAFAFVADVKHNYRNDSGLMINTGGGPQIIYSDDFSNA